MQLGSWFRARWAGWGWPFRVGIVASGLVVGVGLVFGVKPAYHEVRGWRAKALASEAAELAGEGNVSGALQKIHAAYQLAPTRTEVVRTLAQVYESVHPGRALEIWQMLAQAPGFTEEDRLRFADFLLRSGLVDQAGALLNPLLQSGDASAKAWAMAGRWAMARTEWGRASEFLSEAIRRAGDDETEKGEIRFLQMQAWWPQGAEGRRSALEKAWKELESGGSEARGMFEWLASRPELTPEDAARVAAGLERLGLGDSLAMADATLRREPERRAEIFRAVVEQRKGADYAASAEAARWLNQRGGADEVGNLLPFEQARQRRDLFLIWADSMALQGRWQELDKLLEDGSLPLEPVFIRAFRFRIALAMGQEKQAEFHWERALRDAIRQPELLWYLATYAEKLNRTVEAELAYRRLSEDAGLAKVAYLAWVRMLEPRGETKRLREVMAMIAERYPNEPAPHNDLVYLDLLLGKDPVPLEEKAKRLVEASPTTGAFRVTLALALYHQGKVKAALEQFEKFPPAESWPPGWQAVYAATLDRAGQKERAQEIAVNIPRDRLKPEERSLLPR